MSTYNRLIHHKNGEVSSYTIECENTHLGQQNMVYCMSTQDGFCVIGHIASEVLGSRVDKRLTDVKEKDFHHHILKSGNYIKCECLYCCHDEKTLFLLEQIAILDNIHAYLESIGRHVPKDVNIFRYVTLFKDKFANKRFDRKEELRYYLTHPEILNPEDYRVKVLDIAA